MKKPVPDTEIVAVALAEAGFMVIDGARTVKGAETASMAPFVAVAVTVYDAAATLSTMNEPVRVPPEIRQAAPAVTGTPVIVQVESPGDQPEPDTVS